jgi:hypothetical protein
LFNTLVTGTSIQLTDKNVYDAVVIATGDIATENQLAQIIEVAKSAISKRKNMARQFRYFAWKCHKTAQMAVVGGTGKIAAEAVHHYLLAKHLKTRQDVQSQFSCYRLNIMNT